MGKILKKYTKIPEHLYVIRSADEQLERIVDEMQRPGYVLVARQMGKTNLLFNAKRTLENKDRLFVYIDLSNPFEHERDCYRNIIDNVIEPNELLFEPVESEIYTIRDKNLPPHKEYSNSLRVILKHFEGDVVIVLDEIDALRSAQYSDNIFAQIRSNYFSRTNFPVFERLTYILSGVIDPIELIKDRNKSPFNIGDKIYLDDFTKDEHDSFIEKSKLDISNEISNEIYNWANGSPRLTFDICSEIESVLIDGTVITIDVLDSIVRKKYLTTFDVAPVDHIRELVKSHKDVRTSLLKIINNKSNDLSDEIKKKLYLYGIIDSSFDKETRIKNRIIANSLTEGWINSIDKQIQNQLSYGLEMIDQQKYDDAIPAFNYYLIDSEPTKDQLEICNYNLGFAYFQKKNYEKAKEYFSKKYVMDLYSLASKSLLGTSKLAIGESKEGIEILEVVIKSKSNDFAYRNALFHLAPLLSDRLRSIELFEDLYESTFYSKDNSTEAELKKTRVLSRFYMAEIYLKNGQKSEALKGIDEVIKDAEPTDSLYPKLLKYNLTQEKDDQIKSDILDIILVQKSKFEAANNSPIAFCKEHFKFYLELIYEEENLAPFEELLEYAEKELYKENFDRNSLIYTVSKFSEQGESIQKYILRTSTDISKSLLLNIHRDLVSSTTHDPLAFMDCFNQYHILLKDSEETVTEDIRLYSYAIKINSDEGKYFDALALCSEIDSRTCNSGDENLKSELIIIYFWFAILNMNIKNEENALDYANKTIEQVEKLKDKKLSLIDEKGLEIVTNQMRGIKNSLIVNKPFIRDVKYGRNDKVTVKYSDGSIIEDKYKKLEKDIISDKCELIT
jgi:hypothetical protein